MSDTKTPRTDAAVKETKALPDYEAWNESVNAVFARQLETELAARDTELKVLNETHGIQLAAILTACIQNTDASVRGRIGRDNPYWTVAYGDVCVAVDREMRERERAENAERELAAVTAERDRLREVFQVPDTVTDPQFVMDGWRDQHSGALLRLGELERELAELRQRDTCGREELSELRAQLRSCLPAPDCAGAVGRGEAKRIRQLESRLAEEIKWGHRNCTHDDCKSAGSGCPANPTAPGKEGG